MYIHVFPHGCALTLLPCTSAGEILNTSGWISEPLSVGLPDSPTLPSCCPRLCSPVSYSMSLAAFSFSDSAASGCYSQQLCLQSPQMWFCLRHDYFLQLAIEMFLLHSCWPLPLCKWLDGIRKGSQSWGMLMACPSQHSWCWVIGPRLYFYHFLLQTM